MVVCLAIARTNLERDLEQWNYKGESSVESYDKSIRPEFDRAVKKFTPDFMILDEGHYLKNPKNKRTRATFGKGCSGYGLIRRADYICALTGTQMPNNASELWPMLYACSL